MSIWPEKRKQEYMDETSKYYISLSKGTKYELEFKSPRTKDTHPDIFGHITKDTYPSIFGDYDNDGILDADDPNPQTPGDAESIEEVQISDEISKLIDIHNKAITLENEFTNKLGNISDGVIHSRSKTPFSIINKLIRKRLSGKMGITDMIGASITVKNEKEKNKIRNKIQNGIIGKVIEEEDFYTQPQNGYMAYHFIIEYKGQKIELQLKTERMESQNNLKFWEQ